MSEIENNYKAYPVWDKSVRIFHWVNFLSVIALLAIGLVIFNGKALGISGEGKILLKTLHVLVGYIFVLNLLWRIIWMFIGSKYARLAAILPFGAAYKSSLKNFVEQSKAGNPPQYLGHNPIARLMVALLFLLLSMQAVTGLVLAGTDIYYPPFGDNMKSWVAGGDAEKAKLIQAGSKENIDQASYKEMREFRKPFIKTHVAVFYFLLFAIALHILGVALSEIRERNGLVSAMFSGEKVFRSKPVDLDD